jgi:hypothetical protein
MTKREECFEIFNLHPDATRERAIALAVSKAGVTKTTAATYYPAWRKDFVSKPGYVAPAKSGKQEKLKNITESIDTIITEGAIASGEIPEINIEKIVSDAFAKAKKEFGEKSEVITANAKKCAAEKTEEEASQIKEKIRLIREEREGINWKAETLKPVEELFEVTRLVPVVMIGTHGSYHFGKDGVRVVPNETFISKEKMDEALEALEVWERCYGKGGTQAC